MSAATLSGASLVSVQQQFEAALPSMESVIRHHFRNWPARRRADALADARAALWAAWHSLIKRGKDPLQVGITGIAARCCMFTKAGRKIGNRNRGRACLDVLDQRAQRRLGLKILRLDRDEETVVHDGWREWLAEDNRVTPADEAAFRLDFGHWLAGLPERKRQMAELLAEGSTTNEVAYQLGVTAPAVSIARAWLSSDWARFQGEPAPAVTAPGPRPVGRPRKADRCAQRRSAQQAPVPLMGAHA
jgi:hypothetical protein